MACYGHKLTPYVRHQLASALQDVEELYSELPSTLLPEAGQREFWENIRPEYVQRLRKALDHFAAALVAVGCTDSELSGCEPVSRDDEASETPAVEESPAPEETVLLPVPAPADDVEEDHEKLAG